MRTQNHGLKLFAVRIAGGRAEFCWCDLGVMVEIDKSACVGDRSLGVRGDGGGWYKIV